MSANSRREIRDGGPLRILSVAYPLFPVVPGSGGGAEEILRILEGRLVSADYESTVVAAEGSEVSGRLLPTLAANGLISDNVQQHARQQHRETIRTALKRERFDLVHYHGLDFLDYRPHDCKVPELATLHMPLDWYQSGLFRAINVALNCVSESQARTEGSGRVLPIISNGVEVEKFRVTVDKSDYLLWLGRICPEKGTDIALKVAHALDAELIVAGPVHPFGEHQEYFEAEVRPKLDSKRQYVGAVGADEKMKLLAHARCLLVPSLAPETSSLVSMEAISSGTPVIGFRSGALPEVVEEAVTGFLVDSEEEMAWAVSKVDEMLPSELQARAEVRFSAEQMAAQYRKIYQRIIASRSNFE